MTTYLDKVREALDQAEWALLVADKHEWADECRAALSALSAHEAEIKELVTKARALEERAVIVNRNGVNDAELDRLIFEVRAALAKVKP